MSEKYGGLLVAYQFILLVVLAVTTTWREFNFLSLPFFLVSLFLACWAIKVMRLGHFNIRPAIKEGAILVTHGPYRYIRHPMYASVLLAGTGLLLITFNWLRFCAFILLWVVLYLKLRIEEKLLARHFPEYASYKKRSRIFPSWF